MPAYEFGFAIVVGFVVAVLYLFYQGFLLPVFRTS